MARSTNSSVNALVKLGVKYGPLVYEAVKHGKEPAKHVAEQQVARANSRRRALEHAHHLVDGSVLTVFDGDQRLFVVFNGDQPIASHPASRKPLTALIQGYDLDKRVRPAGRPGRIMPRVRTVGGARPAPQPSPQPRALPQPPQPAQPAPAAQPAQQAQPAPDHRSE